VNTRPVIALVDGNNFYVSCERLLAPRLESVPVVVRKLPRLSQKLKVELSGLFPPGGSDEDFAVHRDADRLDPQAV